MFDNNPVITSRRFHFFDDIFDFSNFGIHSLSWNEKTDPGTINVNLSICFKTFESNLMFSRAHLIKAVKTFSGLETSTVTRVDSTGTRFGFLETIFFLHLAIALRWNFDDF